MPLPGFSSKSKTTAAFDKAKVVKAAEKFLSQGKISAAIKEYRKLVDFDPKDFMALNMLGDLYVRNNKKEDAIACFSVIADHYREQGFALKSIAMYKKIDRLNPATPQISFRLAGLYAQLGMVVEARSEYLVVAESYTRSGQTQKALEILRRIADLDPHNAEVRLKLAESYLREGFKQEAAEAFTESGSQLIGQGNYERAQVAFSQALQLFPDNIEALKGVVGTHIALGTAGEAARMLEKALVDRADDLELLALLVQAYLEEQAAAAAESAVLRLVERQPTSYQKFVDVARLYLKANDIDAAVRVVGRVTEPMLAGREDGLLLELLQEALDRKPDHIQALHLLIRIHTWQRDDEKLRASLDRLAEAAAAANLIDEERSALKQLLRFAPAEERYHNRLRDLGIVTASPPAASPEKSAPSTPADDPTPTTAIPDAAAVPTFESFMLAYDGPPQTGSIEESPEQSWDHDLVMATGSADPNSSFADLNDDFATISGFETNSADVEPSSIGAQDLNLEAPPATVTAEPAAVPPRRDTDGMLRQELDSVDFYLAQGYHDIALDTLNMLERQFGAHEEIDQRRARLDAESTAAAAPALVFEEETPPAIEVPAPEFGALENSLLADEAVENVSFALPEGAASLLEMQQAVEPAPLAAPKPIVTSAADTAGIDPGLADIFNEFATAVESEAPPQDADYETHYNLGLAFQEMDLWDDSIEELQTAISLVAPHDGTSRYLQCCNMLGHCFMRKNMMSLAVMWFNKGLSAPGHTEDEYQALRYELGSAYERMGDLDQAISVFTEVYGVNVSYRGVARKVEELQAQRAAR